MRAIYSLDEQSFVDEIPEHFPYGYIIEDLDKGVLVLYTENDELLELNNEEPYSNIVFEYFRDLDVMFMVHVHFFYVDNPHYIPRHCLTSHTQEDFIKAGNPSHTKDGKEIIYH